MWGIFSSLSFSESLYQWCVLNQVPHRGATQLIFPVNVSLAVQVEAKVLFFILSPSFGEAEQQFHTNRSKDKEKQTE